MNSASRDGGARGITGRARITRSLVAGTGLAVFLTLAGGPTPTGAGPSSVHRRPGRRPQGRREPSAFTATTLSVHFYDSISVFERSRHLTGHALGRGLRQAARRRVEEPDRPAAGAIATVARANGNAGRSGGGGRSAG